MIQKMVAVSWCSDPLRGSRGGWEIYLRYHSKVSYLKAMYSGVSIKIGKINTLVMQGW